MRKPLLSLLLAAFLLTPLAGCGGDDEAAPSSTTRVTVTTTTVPVNTSIHAPGGSHARTAPRSVTRSRGAVIGATTSSEPKANWLGTR